MGSSSDTPRPEENSAAEGMSPMAAAEGMSPMAAAEGMSPMVVAVVIF